MQKLKVLLQSKLFILLLLVCFLSRFGFVLLNTNESKFDIHDTEFVGMVEDYAFIDGKIKLEIRIHSEILSGFINESMEQINIGLHDIITLRGSLKELSKATNFYAFDYQNYAKRHRQFYSVEIEKMQIIKKNTNIFYQVKDYFKKRVQTFSTSSYLSAFLLGDTSYISDEIMESYRNNGVSHLFAVSGMHVSFLIGVLVFLLNKIHITEKLQVFIFLIFLSFYVFLIGFSPSVLRASLFFLLLKLNAMYQKNIRPIFGLTIIFFALLFINPYYLWDIGFQYSFSISFVLVIYSTFLREKKNYLWKLLWTSFLAFVASIAISVFHFHQIQLFSVFYNLLFVPLVSFIIFPFSFLIFILPKLEPVYLFFIHLLEGMSIFFAKGSISLWIMRHPNWLGLLYLVLLSSLALVFCFKKKRIGIFVLIIGLFFYHHINFFLKENYLVMIDVGQGDSTIISSGGKVILVDTGGSIYKNIADSTLIPYLKAKGILKIDLLVLTHGEV